MTSVSLPLTFTSLAIAEVKAPLTSLPTTVTSLSSDELLIHLAFASINAMDPRIQRINLFQQPLPFHVGFDFSGTVVAQGGEGEVQVGEDVFGFTSVEGGCFAQYLVVKRERVDRRGVIPAREAGAYGIAYPTAYDPLMTVGKVEERRGQWAFLPGGAGGVGHFAVQIALACGLKVIASAGKPSSLALLRAMGVEHIVDYSRVDVVQEVLRITGGRGADVIFDSTCLPSSFVQSAACVAAGGVFVELGGGVLNVDNKAWSDIVAQRGAAFFVAGHGGLHKNHCMKRAVTWYAEGKVKAYVTKEVRFDAQEVQRVLDDFGAGTGNVGKVVIDIRG